MYGRALGSLECWEKSILCVNRLHVPVRGGAIYRSADGALELVPGHLYFLPNGFASNFELRQGEIYDHLYIDFQTFPPILGAKPLDIDLQSDRLLELMTSAWAQTMSDYEPQSELQKQQIGALLEMIARHLRVRYGVQTVENKKIEQAILFIEEHYKEPMGNDEIARELHVDTRHLIRLFKKYTHIAPYQYLTQRRIEHSLILLRRGKSASEAAELCGFTTDAAFRVAFKKTMGCTPGEFVRQNFYFERIKI